MSKLPRRSFRNGPKHPEAEERAVPASEAWFGYPSIAGVIVNEHTAWNFGAVYSAIAVLASDVSVVPFSVAKREKNGASKIDFESVVHELVRHCPNEDMTALTFIETILVHCCLHGNFYAFIERDGLDPVGLRILDPRTIEPKKDSVIGLYYDEPGVGKYLRQDIVHVKAIGFDGIKGKSPIAQCRETLGLAMAVEKFGASYFGNGIGQKGILETPDELDEPETKELRKQINEEHGGPYKANKFMLLQGGLKFTPTQIQADEAQFLETRQFQLLEICRIFRLPPTKLQDYSKSPYAMLEETNLDYYRSSLLPWFRRIETELNRKLFTREQRRIWSVEHDTNFMLKGRMLDQANVHKILREMGVLNSDEIRAFHGLGPIEGGDSYFVPLNQAPLDKVANASIETLKGVKPDASGPAVEKGQAEGSSRASLIEAALAAIYREKPWAEGARAIA